MWWRSSWRIVVGPFIDVGCGIMWLKLLKSVLGLLSKNDLDYCTVHGMNRGFLTDAKDAGVGTKQHSKPHIAFTASE